MDSKPLIFSEHTMERNERWDRRFLRLAKEVSRWSRDPSSRVGAIAVRDRRVLATGYNGLPRGVVDSPERLENRELKYQMTAHAETNALAAAAHSGVSLAGSTIYIWPYHPCSNCAGLLINAGIERVVFPDFEVPERWVSNFCLAQTMFNEADVMVDAIEMDVREEVAA
jgi:dCMP deaminase